VHADLACGLAPERDLRTVHLKNARVTARSAASGHDTSAGKEAKFHEPASFRRREIDPI
jgi:hypothetical protein